MQFRLRTLLILLGLAPPLLAGGWLVWEHQIVMPRQRRLQRLNALRAPLNTQIAELQASQNAKVLQLQQLSAARAKMDAQIDALQARMQNTREMKLQQLWEEYGEDREMYYEQVRQLLLRERLGDKGFPDQPQAAAGIYFLGPELARSKDAY